MYLTQSNAPYIVETMIYRRNSSGKLFLSIDYCEININR